jgi:hypothetical protein
VLQALLRLLPHGPLQRCAPRLPPPPHAATHAPRARAACPDVVFFSTPPYHGTLSRWHLHPAAWLHKLPPSVSFEEGALCEPLAVALAGIERAELRLGDPTFIACVSRHARPLFRAELTRARAV